MYVSLDSVSKVFTAGPRALSALAPITLEIVAGEFVCLIGPSGCGKSTLLRLIADQIKPSAGEIQLDGESPSRARQANRIAWMAQNPALLPWKTVLENTALPQVLKRRRRRTAPAPAPLDLLAMVRLSDFTTAYPQTLSGGMQQRVALARTLATGAPLWLMDEPFAALDELTREQLTEELLRLWATFRPTVLWVTHHVPEAARLADRVAVLTPSPGRIKAVVPIDLPRPRDETSPPVSAVIRTLRKLLRK